MQLKIKYILIILLLEIHSVLNKLKVYYFVVVNNSMSCKRVVSHKFNYIIYILDT